MRSVMKHQFSRVPHANIPRSNFNRSHGYKTTFDSGWLVPFYLDEVLPGDTFNLHATLFARLATPIAPIMDNLFMDTFYFFVPNRLIWENWERFNGAQDNPGDSVDYLVPYITSPPQTGWPVGSLSDYMGLPTGISGIEVDSLWHRAYNLIWNEWFRDENLQDSVPVPKDDGPDDDSDFVLLRRGKRHDYFTSALPWPQKGPGMEVPIGGEAPVQGGVNVNLNVTGNGAPIFTTGGTPTSALKMSAIQAGNNVVNVSQLSSSSNSLSWSNPNLKVAGAATHDLHVGIDQTGVTINALREAFQLQKLFERDARGGTRYTEILRSHFGVVSPDSRLQRPEYLGGGSARVIINPVPQTDATNNVSPQGNLAAFGIVSSGRGGFVKSFVEHGVIIGLVSVRADLTYQQGIPRMFSRQSRWDFYWPSLAHLGEQAILNKEIYAQGPSVLNPSGEPIDNDVFGYQERWAEYRYFPSQITGQFRSTYAQTLDYWHLSQKFDNLPALTDEWIQDNPPVDRVIAVPSEPHFIFDSYLNLQCARPMPVYSVPGLIDHF